MRTRPALILGLFLALGLVLAPAPGQCADDRAHDVSIDVARTHLDFHAGKDLVARYVIDRDKKGKIVLARDHGGPWQNTKEIKQGLSLRRAMESAKASYRADLEAGASG